MLLLEHPPSGEVVLRRDGRELVRLEVDGSARLDARRSHDGGLALLAITWHVHVVDLAREAVVAAFPTDGSEGIAVPLGAGRTLAVEGGVDVDFGHTPHGSSGAGWMLSGGGTQAELDAMVPGLVADLERRSLEPRRFRVVVGLDGREVVVHDELQAPRLTTTSLLWPPVDGPEGMLLRRARTTTYGRIADFGPAKPWVLGRDGGLGTIPIDLGVSPLCALERDRWLLPDADVLWRDDLDSEPAVLHRSGAIVPWRPGGRRLRPSALLAEVVTHLVAELAWDGGGDPPWRLVAARPAGVEVLLSVEVDEEDGTGAVVVAAPAEGDGPLRLVADLRPPRGGVVVPLL